MMHRKILHIITVMTLFIVGFPVAAQNIVDTYSQECGKAFRYVVDSDRHEFHYIRVTSIHNPDQVKTLTAVEQHAYRTFQEKKLYNYVLPEKGEVLHISIGHYLEKGYESIRRGFRVEFLFGQSTKNRVRMYFVINGQKPQLLHLIIDTPAQKRFWVCEGFKTTPTKGDTVLYHIAQGAGPYFDYAKTPYQFNVAPLEQIEQLGEAALATGRAYKKNLMKRKPHLETRFANRQYAIMVNGTAVGHVVTIYYNERDNLINGGAIFLFVNLQGKIVAERG